MTLDFTNTEHASPEVRRLRSVTEASGLELRDRLAVYPEYVRSRDALAAALREGILALSDSSGLVRRDEER
jgi:FO synthase